MTCIILTLHLVSTSTFVFVSVRVYVYVCVCMYVLYKSTYMCMFVSTVNMYVYIICACKQEL